MRIALFIVYIIMHDYVITTDDLKDFYEGKRGNRVERLWKNLLEKLPSNLRKEAEKRGFRLVHNPNIEEDPLAQYMIVTIPDSSPQLREEVEQQTPAIICIKDY